MKKYIILVILCFFLKTAFSQEYTCDKLPHSDSLMSKLVKRPISIGYLYQYKNGCNITDSFKNRVVKMLNWRWTAAEIDSFNVSELKANSKFLRHEKIAEYYAKGNDSIYKVVIDSIRKDFVETNFKSKKQNIFKVNPGLILLAGSLNIKEAIPILSEGVKEREHYDSISLELALAKLGDKVFENKIVTSCSYTGNFRKNYIDDYMFIIRPKLFYLATQQSIFKLNEWLDTSQLYASVPGKKQKARFAYLILADLKNIILNPDFAILAKDIPNYWSPSDPICFTDEPILKCKNWLKKNKGKYKINYDYCLYKIRRLY